MSSEKLPEKNFVNQPELEKQEREPVNIRSVSTDNADYRIVRSIHIFPNNLEELARPDFVALETGAFHYRGMPLETIKQMEGQIQYAKVLDELRDRETPVY